MTATTVPTGFQPSPWWTGLGADPATAAGRRRPGRLRRRRRRARRPGRRLLPAPGAIPTAHDRGARGEPGRLRRHRRQHRHRRARGRRPDHPAAPPLRRPRRVRDVRRFGDRRRPHRRPGRAARTWTATWNCNGQLVCAVSERQDRALRAQHRSFAELGFDIPYLPAEDLADRFGGRPYLSALRHPLAATLDPVRLCRSLAERLTALGVSIHERQPGAVGPARGSGPGCGARRASSGPGTS